MIDNPHVNNLRFFYKFICENRKINIKLIIIILFLLLLPTENQYVNTIIVPGKRVVRAVNIPEIGELIIPVEKEFVRDPMLTAQSVIVIDVPTKTIIFAKNPDKKLMPASTTKIMTALVALDSYKLDEIVPIENNSSIGQIMKLEKGEKISVESLLYGVLVQSGNDAADALAGYYKGGREKFIQEMNNKAKTLNMLETHFTNPSGIDKQGHFTTAHDLAILASEAMRNNTFAKIVNTKEIVISDETGNKKHDLKNVNQLIGKVAGIKGIKTGWTENAGECLVAYVERDGKKIITVILASEDRFGETQLLINWIFNSFNWLSLKSS